MFNQYAAGNKIYQGGLPNPTSGTVDPTGYVEREMKNKAKPKPKTNQSNRRSGNASAMMRLHEKYQKMLNPPPISTPQALKKAGLNVTPTGQLGNWQKRNMGA